MFKIIKKKTKSFRTIDFYNIKVTKKNNRVQN